MYVIPTPVLYEKLFRTAENHVTVKQPGCKITEFPGFRDTQKHGNPQLRCDRGQKGTSPNNQDFI